MCHFLLTYFFLMQLTFFSTVVAVLRSDVSITVQEAEFNVPTLQHSQSALL